MDGEIDEGDCFVCFVSFHLVVWRRRAVCIAYSKSACKFRPPRERACLVLVQTRLLYCHQSAMETRSGHLGGICRENHAEPVHTGVHMYVSKSEVTRIQKHKLQRLLWGWNQSAKAQTCRQTVETDSPYLAFHTTIHANRRESGMRHPSGDKAVKCRLPHQNVACAR